eukprot:3940426-Rhodomonas_salina.2
MLLCVVLSQPMLQYFVLSQPMLCCYAGSRSTTDTVLGGALSPYAPYALSPSAPYSVSTYAPYAISGADIAYAATRCVVLTAMLQHVWY